LQEYARRYPERFTVLPTTAATGSAQQNFLRLIEAAVATSDAEYFAFADQDDVWLPAKIELEMAAMRGLEHVTLAGRPMLVFSDLRIVDRNLQTLHDSMWAKIPLEPQNVRRLERLLVQNVVTGCTAVINRPMARLARQMPARAYMHDWWIALLANVFGAAAAVNEVTVLYRQHGNNVMGVTSGEAPRGVPRWRYHGPRKAQWEIRVRQAEAFVAVHGTEMPRQKRVVFERLVHCETQPNRIVRALTWLVGGFYLSGGLRPNLGMLWYLWDMAAAKKKTP
jgi:hypothetical protein